MDQVVPGTIKVVGSAEMQVAPDQAVVELVVSREADAPGPAFDEARAASAAVLSDLRQRGVDDIRSSRINLHQRDEWTGNRDDRQRRVLFVASIGHRVTTADLDGLEALLSGVVSSGANELRSVQFETSELAELRRRVRAEAVAAGRAKAELYAEAAGVGLGTVTTIEDLSYHGSGPGPQMRGVAAMGGPEDASGAEPGTITIEAQVNLWFEIT